MAVSVQDRRAALRRAAARVRWSPMGCLGPVVAAWPERWARLSAGDVAMLVRVAGLKAALTAAFGQAETAPAQTAAPGDPMLVAVDGRALAGLAVGGGGVLIATPAGPVTALRRSALAFWDAGRAA